MKERTLRERTLRRGRVVTAMVAAVAILTGPAPAEAAPGDLDASFSGDGRLVMDLTSGLDAGLDLVVAPDGKIVVAGRTGGSGGQMLVSRFLPDGSPDVAFAGDGHATVDLSPGDDIAYGVVLQPTGEIVVAGEASGNRMAFARLTAAGALDPTFAGTGTLLLNPSAGRDVVKDLVLGAGGEIIGAGTVSDRTTAVRLTPAGVPDPGFGGDGIVTIDYPAGPEWVRGVARQANGAVVVVGVIDGPPPARQRVMLTRFTAGGTLDPAFSGDGRFSVNLFLGYEDAQAVAIRPDGKLVVGCEVAGRFCLLRLTPGGALDPTFSGDGRVWNDLPGGNEWVSSLALQADGRIVVGGHIDGGGGRAIVARYTAGGLLDPTFSQDGYSTANPSPGYDLVESIAIQPDGRLVTVGAVDSHNRFFVQRHLAA